MCHQSIDIKVVFQPGLAPGALRLSPGQSPLVWSVFLGGYGEAAHLDPVLTPILVLIPASNPYWVTPHPGPENLLVLVVQSSCV